MSNYKSRIILPGVNSPIIPAEEAIRKIALNRGLAFFEYLTTAGPGTWDLEIEEADLEKQDLPLKEYKYPATLLFGEKEGIPSLFRLLPYEEDTPIEKLIKENNSSGLYLTGQWLNIFGEKIKDISHKLEEGLFFPVDLVTFHTDHAKFHFDDKNFNEERRYLDIEYESLAYLVNDCLYRVTFEK